MVGFSKAIIAAGSEPVSPGFIPQDPRIWDSTGALELKQIPERLLVLGGGIIGLEMAKVYDALGSEITVIEMMDQLMPGADRDIVAPFAKRVEKRYSKILLKTKVTKVEARPDALHVTYEGAAGAETSCSTRCWSRSAAAQRRLDWRGRGRRRGRRARLHRRRQQMRTNVDEIFAIGDLVGQPMLAHKATPKAGGGGSRQRPKKCLRQARRSPPSPTPTRKSPGPASPRLKPKRRASEIRQDRLPVGCEPAARCSGAATRA